MVGNPDGIEAELLSPAHAVKNFGDVERFAVVRDTHAEFHGWSSLYFEIACNVF
jgi:hypothetical protein